MNYTLLGALTAAEFCSKTNEILSLIGTFITIFKWAIPILLIVVGSFDLGKAVVQSDPNKIKDKYSGLIKRAVAAVVIFFLPALVGLIMDAVDGRNNELSSCTDALGLKF